MDCATTSSESRWQGSCGDPLQLLQSSPSSRLTSLSQVALEDRPRDYLRTAVNSSQDNAGTSGPLAGFLNGHAADAVFRAHCHYPHPRCSSNRPFFQKCMACKANTRANCLCQKLVQFLLLNLWLRRILGILALQAAQASLLTTQECTSLKTQQTN